MTIDENPYAEPEWMRLARETEAADRAAYRERMEDRDLCESIEAEEALRVGINRAMPDHVRAILYEGDR